MDETRGIKIAIVDSGVNAAHSHVEAVEGGVSFELDMEGNVVTGGAYTDEIGHGTAIAGVIREKNPTSMLYAVKIFDKELAASTSLLLAALRWSIDAEMKVIHLSLGTEKEADRAPLDSLCKQAHDNGIIIIASARSPDDMVFPAAFETVIGACWDKDCDDISLSHYPESPIEFGACGLPRSLPGLAKRMNFQGHSFAAAHVTARAARLLADNPDRGTAWVRKKLAEDAQTRG
jgi:hypothetical protein